MIDLATSAATAEQQDAILGSSEPKKPLSGAWALVRRHWVFLVALLAGSVLRVLASVAYQPGLFAGGDSKGYIVNSEHLVPGGYRPAGYAVFLRIFSFASSIAVVTVVQHLLVVAAAVGLYLLLLRFGLRPGLAAVVAAPVLLDAYQIQSEQFIMADTLAEVLVISGIVALLWRRRPSVVQIVVGGLLLAMAGVTRTVALPLLVLAMLYLLALRVGWVRLVAFVMAAASLLLAYAGWYDSTNHKFALQEDSGIFLYGRVAPFANCRSLVLPPIEQKLCQTTPPSTRPLASYYIWDSHSPLRLYVPGALRFRVANDFAQRIIAHQPVTYLHVVVGDTVHYFAPGHPIGRGDWPLSSSEFPPRHPDPKSQIGLITMGYSGQRVVPVFVSPVATLLRGYQVAGYVPGPVLGACLVSAVGVGFGLFRRRRGPVHSERGRRARSQISDRTALDHQRAAALLFALAGLATIASASFTAEFAYRYGIFLIPLLPPAGALAAYCLLPEGWTRRLRSRWRLLIQR